MADEGGEGFGYFLALLLLICGIPTMLLLVGVLRKKRGNRFESKLGESALQSTVDRRRAFVLRQVEEMNNSLKNRTSKLLKAVSLSEAVGGEDAEDNYEQHSLRVFQAGLLQGRSYWGISDILVKDGVLISRGDVSFSLPPGLLEDFLFTAFNKINPLPLCFGDDRHPESMLIRFTVYCTAQTFTLTLFLLYYNTFTTTSYLLSPLVVLCEHWLRLTLFCPCLSKGGDIQDEINDEEDTNRKLRRYSGIAVRNGVRGRSAGSSRPGTAAGAADCDCHDASQSPVAGETFGRVPMDGDLMPLFDQAIVALLSVHDVRLSDIHQCVRLHCIGC